MTKLTVTRELIQTLENGVHADIWFDAYSHGEVGAMKVIKDTKEAMNQASQILKEIYDAGPLNQMRNAVADDLYHNVTNDSRARSALVDAHVNAMTDDEVMQAYADAELGESIDDDEEIEI